MDGTSNGSFPSSKIYVPGGGRGLSKRIEKIEKMNKQNWNDFCKTRMKKECIFVSKKKEIRKKNTLKKDKIKTN